MPSSGSNDGLEGGDDPGQKEHPRETSWSGGNQRTLVAGHQHNQKVCATIISRRKS